MRLANHNKNTFLGLNFSTASARLRKAILFKLIQETQRDVCFKCGFRIETADELSIEHKEPWLYNDPSLFWDLGNIAFSHRGCNKPHRSSPHVGARKIGPNGTSWCLDCKKFLPVKEFCRGARFNGLNERCREHLRLSKVKK